MSGGGEGALIGAVLRARPGLDGILFDLPAGLAGATAYLEKAGVVDRCRLVEGSFLDSVPSADLYLLRRVLHDWDDEQAVGILRACARSMSSGGRLLVMETLLPERVVAGPADERVTLLDMHMLVLFGSRERSEAEYASLLERAGLRHTRTIPTGRRASVIEALKPAR